VGGSFLEARLQEEKLLPGGGVGFAYYCLQGEEFPLEAGLNLHFKLFSY